MEISDKSLQEFAADCAEHVLECFEEHYPADRRPRAAIEAARILARRRISPGSAEKAAAQAAGAAYQAAGAAYLAAPPMACAAYAAYAAAQAALATDHDYVSGALIYSIAAARAAAEQQLTEEQEWDWAEEDEHNWQRERFEEFFGQPLDSISWPIHPSIIRRHNHDRG